MTREVLARAADLPREAAPNLMRKALTHALE
jgi:hypothetical protein